MKIKLFPILTLFPISLLAATNEPALRKGWDFTGQSRIAASQLNQLVDNSYPTNGRSWVISTNLQPDHTNNAYITNSIWVDYSTQPPTIKVWTASSNVWNQIIVTNVTPGDNTVSTAKIVNGAVTSDKIGAGAVTTAKISSGNITPDLIASDAVTRPKILNGSIDGTKLTNGAIDSANLFSAGVITRTILADNSVGATVISNFAIGADKLQSNSIFGYAISNGVVNSDKIGAGALVNSNYAARSVSTNSVDTNIYHLLPKVWAVINPASQHVTNQHGFNLISSISTPAAGLTIVTFATAFPNTNYNVIVTAAGASPGSSKLAYDAAYVSNTTTTVTLLFNDNAGSAVSPTNASLIIYNNQ